MDAVQQIELYTNLFYASAVLAGLGLAMAIFFFFYFDIRTVYALMTGKAKEETIRRMAEKNARTGNLRSTGMTGQTGAVTSDRPMIQHPAPSPAAMQQTMPLSQAQPEYHTAVLDMAAPETSVLQEEEQQTMVLGAAAPAAVSADTVATEMLKPISFGFRVTESVMLIHTKELI